MVEASIAEFLRPQFANYSEPLVIGGTMTTPMKPESSS